MSEQSIAEAAARWFVRRRSEGWDHTQEEALAAWLAEDPAHAQAFEALQSLWAELDQVPEDLRSAAPPARPRRPARRRIGRPLALGSVALLLGLCGGIVYFGFLQPVYQHTFTTSTTPHHDIVLPDGSIIALNVHSEATVRYVRQRRDLTLTRGEAIFHVQPEAQRPFVVRAKGIAIRVLGTRFNVGVDIGGGPASHSPASAPRLAHSKRGNNPDAYRPCHSVRPGCAARPAGLVCGRPTPRDLARYSRPTAGLGLNHHGRSGARPGAVRRGQCGGAKRASPAGALHASRRAHAALAWDDLARRSGGT